MAPDGFLSKEKLRKTYAGNADIVIHDLERLVIQNEFIVRAVEETAIDLFRSGLKLDGNAVREIWLNAYKASGFRELIL